MDAVMVVVAFVAAAALVCWVYYGVIAVRVFVMGRTVPTVRDGAAMVGERGGAWPRVCIVVPGHNEERMIGGLVRSLAAQEYAGELRVVLSLDRCTDGTARVAGEAIAAAGEAGKRFEIVVVDACPEGWAGKVHAVHRGVRDSEGAREADVLVFVDADTELDARCIAGAVALMEAREVDLLSAMCTLTSDAWWEKVAQPAAGIELVRRFPLDRLNRKGGKIPFANGQFMAFRRGAYENIGGHEAVRDELLEDLAMAERVVQRKRGLRLGVFMADGMVRCRMYESMGEFRRGWKRIFGESFRRDPQRLRSASVRVVMMGVVAPIAAVAALVLGGVVVLGGDGRGWTAVVTGAMGVVAMGAALGQMYASQGLGWWWAATHPIGAWMTASIEREAASDLEAGTRTQWGGMSYVRERRK